MLVVFLFLRRGTPTIAAGITVPLSLAGTCAAMWAVGYSINNLSLMALAVSVGFVVDDAIVMIENMFRNLEKGHSPLRAAYEGARQIGFTIVTISISLIAAFIPLLFMDGVVGRVFREFSLTLTFAVVISMFVSLSVTPMICAHFVREPPSPDRTWLDRAVEAVLVAAPGGLCAEPRFRAAPPHHHAGRVARNDRAHRAALSHHAARLLPAGRYRPGHGLDQCGARHLVQGDGRAAAAGGRDRDRRSGGRERRLHGRRLGVERLGQPRTHVHRLEAARRARRPVERARDRPHAREGVARAGHRPVDGAGAGPARRRRGRAPRTTSSPCGATTSTSCTSGCRAPWRRSRTLPGFVDVSTDRESSGLQLNVSIDRQAAARLGVRIQDIETALNNAFAQRQISTIYTRRNQYRVILEIDPAVPARPGGPHAHLRAGQRRRPGSAVRLWRSSSARSRRS